MATFEYQALDAQGKTRTGVLQGDTARGVRQQLREQKLTPLSVEAVTRSAKRRERLSGTELAVVLRQLATLSRAGLPIAEALGAVAGQAARRAQQRILTAIRARVLEGYPLATGMREFPRAFPELVCATVEAGEEGGQLDQVLDKVADYAESSQSLRQSTWLALLYPVLLTFVSIAVTVGLVGFVVPQVVGVFANMGQDLPTPTRILMAISDFVVQYGLWMGLGFVAVMVVLVLFWRQPAGRTRLQNFLMRLPLWGRLLRTADTARFARTLGILLSSGVPAVPALRVSTQVLTLLPFRRKLEVVSRQVREGGSIGRALENSGGFPPVALRLISSGEKSGQLADMLDRAADHLEQEYQSWLKTMIGLLQPLLILVVGVMVLFIVLAILLPIFEYNQIVA